MTNISSSHNLSRISEFIASKMGLHFSEARWDDLERGLGSASREFGFTDTEEFIKWLMSSQLTKSHIEILASHLTVGESYFFREKESFDALEERILPELIRSRQGNERHLRIWSAGCSTGEEPYSIAILLSRMIADLKDWNTTILATDINPRSLKKASEGLYTEWSFRSVPSWVREGYFKKRKDGFFEVLPNLKKMVVFEYLNLAEDVYPSLLNNTNAMDMIFCRNVLMYFSAEQAKKVIQGIYKSLMEGGWLFVSPAEASSYLSSHFVTVHFPGAILYRKDTKKPLTMEDFRKPVKAEAEPPRLSKSILEQKTESFGTQSLRGKDVVKPKKEEPLQDLYTEAGVMFEQGRYAEAAEKLGGLYLQGKTEPKVTALLSRAYANQGRLDDALKWCEKAVGADTLNPVYHYLLATILQEQGRIDRAVMYLKRALYLDHNFVLAYFALGSLMQRLGEPKTSRKYLKSALGLLSRYSPEEVLPESEGITAGRLSEVIASMIQ